MENLNIFLCPICNSKNIYEKSVLEWPRDRMFCKKCYSNVRQRSLFLSFKKLNIKIENMKINHFSPTPNCPVDKYFSKNCNNYNISRYFDNIKNGTYKNGILNVDIENIPFPNNSYDILITMDIFEHIFNPIKAIQEIYRVLKYGGYYLMTVPIDNGLNYTEKPTKKVNSKIILLPTRVGKFKGFNINPEYHGNPDSNNKSIVTYYWGYDIIDFIKKYTDFEVEINHLKDLHEYGICGIYNETIICKKVEKSLINKKTNFIITENMLSNDKINFYNKISKDLYNPNHKNNFFYNNKIIPNFLKNIKYFVICSGKCGSSTLHKTFEINFLDNDSLQCHNNYDFNHNKNKNIHWGIYDIIKKKYQFENNLKICQESNFDLYDLIKENMLTNNKIYIIDSYRLPIERKISSFFQNITIHLPNFNDLKIEEIIEKFNNNFFYKIEEYHSINEILNYFNIENFNEFNFKNKYVKKNYKNIEFIKIRFQDINEWDKILSNIFNTNIEIHSNNLTKDKEIYELYEEFKRHYKVPKNYLEEILINDKEFKVYNTKEEQELYLNKWHIRSY